MTSQILKIISGAICLYQGLSNDITSRQFWIGDPVPLKTDSMVLLSRKSFFLNSRDVVKHCKYWGKAFSILIVLLKAKVGIRNLRPHLRNFIILHTTKAIAELRTKKLWNCNCGPSKFDFRKSATFRSLLPVLLLSSPFSSAQDGFKNKQIIFLQLSVSQEAKNLP
jgi:hypothetical protein